MKLRTSYDYGGPPELDWTAIDEDTYDGAPGSRTRNQVGHGRTEQDAIRMLMEILEDDGADWWQQQDQEAQQQQEEQ